MAELNLRECPSTDQLMEIVTREVGLDDFGDPERNRGAEAFMGSMAEEVWPEMTDRARYAAIDFLKHHYASRLKLVADRQAYSLIAREVIEAPLIVVGPPRSGSTLMHTLLSLDPQRMAPEHWVCREPSPPIALGKPTPQRLDEAERRLMELFALIPGIFVTHPYMIEEGAGALAECGSDILNMVGTSQQMWCFWGGESYRRYLLEADHSAALSFHHDFLQHLQWGQTGKRWALKGSDHMLWMRELAAQYPDAKLIWTHRDLGQQLGSLASVQSILLGLRGHPVTSEQRKAQGRRAIDLQRASVEKAMKARDDIGEDAFVDVSYHALLADPLGTVERIYDRCGLSVSDRHADEIRVWTTNHHQAKHGVHRHSPDDFGMKADEINAEFAHYLERFGFGFGIRPELAV